MHWLVESDVFPERYARFEDAIRAAGHRCTRWEDAWWEDGLPRLDEPVLFHGSLGNADRVRREGRWHPGAFCDADAFRCSAWYPRAERWLLHRSWLATTARALVEGGSPSDPFFVRPDSPLKPFSGRVLTRDALSLSALDHGFYYDDADLPVIVCPVVRVDAEWRFVVVQGQVVAGSAYVADGRQAVGGPVPDEVLAFARDVVAGLEPPEVVYVLDVCASEGRLRLLELNPFSGADLYACDPGAVVDAVSACVTGMLAPRP